jgi:hypothetical protein
MDAEKSCATKLVGTKEEEKHVSKPNSKITSDKKRKRSKSFEEEEDLSDEEDQEGDDCEESGEESSDDEDEEDDSIVVPDGEEEEAAVLSDDDIDEHNLQKVLELKKEAEKFIGELPPKRTRKPVIDTMAPLVEKMFRKDEAKELIAEVNRWKKTLREKAEEKGVVWPVLKMSMTLEDIKEKHDVIRKQLDLESSDDEEEDEEDEIETEDESFEEDEDDEDEDDDDESDEEDTEEEEDDEEEAD